jgi:hypothetical protein
LASNAGNFSDSKFGSQINAAAGGLSRVDAKLASARQAYQQNALAASQTQALSSVSGIHASAMDIIQRAGEASPGDPNAPTQDQVSDAVSIRASIESSGALESGAAAQNWLKNEAAQFSNSTLGEDVSSAISRAANPKGSQNEEDMNG